MNNEKFGKFIAELRKDNNMTQKEYSSQSLFLNFHVINNSVIVSFLSIKQKDALLHLLVCNI